MIQIVHEQARSFKKVVIDLVKDRISQTLNICGPLCAVEELQKEGLCSRQAIKQLIVWAREDQNFGGKLGI